MNNLHKVITKLTSVAIISIWFSLYAYSQNGQIINHSINSNGQIQIEVSSTPNNYYVLQIRNHIDSSFSITSAIKTGEDNSTIITEPLEAYPIEHYQVLEYSLNSAEDIDGDGIDDISELQNIPFQNPINAAISIEKDKGLVTLDRFDAFKELAINQDLVNWNEYLNGLDFLKYIITDFNMEHPKLYFINCNTFDLHVDFAEYMGFDPLGEDVVKGQILYLPSVISNNGSLGTFCFNYSVNNTEDFVTIQRTHEILASNMLFIENNLSYFVNVQTEDEYEQDEALFKNSRIPVIFESDAFAEIDYWGLNQAEGYGLFRKLEIGEIPNSKDIILCETLPNSLPRVGGIISSFIQTPLSHINLRAIQDDIPNAFIRDPLEVESIRNLLDHYIYFKVEQNHYIIREASLDEVNLWYDNQRPASEQFPSIDLRYDKILPLGEIDFNMAKAFGAKCTNVATLHRLGFPENTIPSGYGIPFYYYQKFMEYNNLFIEIKSIIEDPGFKSDRKVREELLDDFRKKIKKAEMPEWMLHDLENMHLQFPEGTSIRCRSSSNNEDIPGFSGAGLYSSKTQHPDEGHISKSIKQVYASLWNLRAYEEREFFKIDHFVSSMGVLCHPNYTNEKVNGVGVSTDPIYNTQDTYYLNSQLGEDLITNPETNSLPEEILLDQVSNSEKDFLVIRHSNLIHEDSLLMNEEYILQMREYLTVIHNEFAKLYDAVNNSTFAMDIEYKITSEGQLVIKQARPWAMYVPEHEITPTYAEGFTVYPNPANDHLHVTCTNHDIFALRISNVFGQEFMYKGVVNTNNSVFLLNIEDLPRGLYIITGLTDKRNILFSSKFFKTD